VQILQHHKQRLSLTGIVQEPAHGVVAAQGRCSGFGEPFGGSRLYETTAPKVITMGQRG
jgi:hypothetical protein